MWQGALPHARLRTFGIWAAICIALVLPVPAAATGDVTQSDPALDARLLETELEAISEDPDLLSYAVAGGAVVFQTECAVCHGEGAEGGEGGFPNLIDEDWLWGGTVTDIHQTILHGVRAEEDIDSRFSEMPAFDYLLTAEEIDAVAQYILSLSGAEHDAGLAAAGTDVFLNNCTTCHGEEAEGLPELGAPRLSDGIWLFGGDPETLHETIALGRNGVMPSFSAGDLLSPADIRKAALYVHSLGGGQ